MGRPTPKIPLAILTIWNPENPIHPLCGASLCKDPCSVLCIFSPRRKEDPSTLENCKQIRRAPIDFENIFRLSSLFFESVLFRIEFLHACRSVWKQSSQVNQFYSDTDTRREKNPIHLEFSLLEVIIRWLKNSSSFFAIYFSNLSRWTRRAASRCPLSNALSTQPIVPW